MLCCNNYYVTFVIAFRDRSGRSQGAAENGEGFTSYLQELSGTLSPRNLCPATLENKRHWASRASSATFAAVLTLAAGSLIATPDDARAQGYAAGNATASGTGSLAIGSVTGSPAVASGFASVAVGQGANATATSTSAFGTNANATSDNATAIGENTTASGVNSTVIGFGASANSTGGISIGNASSSTNAGALAIGQVAISSGTNALAIGTNSIAGGNNSMAQGNGAVAGIIGSPNIAGDIAIGTGTQATGGQSLGLGYLSAATAFNAVAIGNRSTASGANSFAAGNASTAAGNSTIAIGDTATVVPLAGLGSTAIGYQSQVQGTGTGGVAIGNREIVSGEGAVAIGNPNTATGSGSVAIGDQNNATANGSVALGYLTSAVGQGSVALGNKSSAASAGGIALGDTALATLANGVAIGTNSKANYANDVALGSNSVTSQAVATNSITLSGTTYNFAGVNPGSTVSVGAAGAERTITNVAAGRINATSTDAVNGSELYATNQALTSLSNGGAGPVQYANAGTPTAPNGGVPSQYLTLVGAAPGPVTLSNVAPGSLGSSSTQAVNGSQINTFGTSIATYLGGGMSFNSSTGTFTAPVYVVSGNNYNTVGGAIAALASGGNTAKYLHANSTLADSNPTGMNSVAIGPVAVSSGANSVAIGNGAIANNAYDVALGAGSQTGALHTGVTDITGGTAAGAGVTSFGIVSVGVPGSERQVQNVGAGTLSATSTDAVNGSQLYSVAKAGNTTGATVANALGGGSTYTPGGGVSTPSYTVAGGTYDNVGSALAALDAANASYTSKYESLAAGLAYANQRIDKAYAGTAIALSLPTPVFHQNQTFVLQAGWGDFEGMNALGLTAAGLIGRDCFGMGSTVTVSGGFGASGSTIAGRAAVAIGW
jgi:autotransporter adhesin